MILVKTPLFSGEFLTENIPVIVQNTPSELKKSLKGVTKYLNEQNLSDESKCVLFSYWIIKNIKYDKSQVRQLKRNKIPSEVVRDRSAVCGGYSALFKHFCDEAQIPCFYIKGYARGNIIERTFKKKHLRHAWNAVYVDGKWELWDVTWMQTELKNLDKKAPFFKWANTAPKEFSKTHFPDNPMWQMLDNPKNKKEFIHKKEGTQELYAYKDSLQVYLNKNQVNQRLMELRGRYYQHQSMLTFQLELNDLIWEYIGGTYDADRIKIGIELINYMVKIHESAIPYSKDSYITNQIILAKRIANWRLENKD